MNKNKCIFLLLLVLCFPQVVYAATDCGLVLGSGLKQIIVDFFDYARIAAIGLVFILTTVDFAKGIISQDSDQLKKSTNTALKRLGLALAVFFLPILLDLLFDLIDIVGGTCLK